MRKITTAVLALGLMSCDSATSPPAEQEVLDVAAIHASALVLDAHADIEIPGQETRYAGDDGRSQVAPDKMVKGGVDAVVMSVAVGPDARTPESYAAAQQRAAEEITAINGIVSANEHLVLATTSEELIAAHESGNSAYILGLQNARILAGDPETLRDYYRQGIRVLALTHMGHNAFADSSRPVFVAELGRHEADAEHGGLSDLGREAVSLANELGIILDVSQLSQEATMEMATLSAAPVIASHSNVRALSDVSRNLSDEEIDLIAERGGVIHVAPFRGYLFDSSDTGLDQAIREARRDAGIKEDYLYPFELYWEIEDDTVQAEFLGRVSALLGPGSVDVMLDHVDYIARRAGVDHVGIGTDFNHGSGIQGFSDASEAMSVTAGLLERGYSVEDIHKIWGGNFLRVFAEVEKLSAR